MGPPAPGAPAHRRGNRGTQRQAQRGHALDRRLRGAPDPSAPEREGKGPQGDCVPEAISVGAVYDADFGSLNWGVCSDPNAATDTFACFTNSGDLLDLLAPGWQTSTVGNSDFGGTSAASPYAAGQAALLLQKDGQLSPAAIRALMTQSGPLVVNPATSESYPRSDVAEALPEPGTLLTLVSGAALLGMIGHRRYAR